MPISPMELNTYTRQRQRAKNFYQVILDFIEVGQKLEASLINRQENWKHNGYSAAQDKLLVNREEDLIIGLLEDSADVLGLKMYRIREISIRIDE